MGQNRQADQLVTPEIQTLFEEWARQLDSEVLGLVESEKEMVIDAMAAQLKITRDSLIFFLIRLARQGNIDLKPAKNNRPPRIGFKPQSFTSGDPGAVRIADALLHGLGRGILFLTRLF